MELAKLLVSILGFGGAISALIFGIRQYGRAEQWKRGEFVAKEIKEFESDPVVRNAFLMIDWGKRKVNLFLVQNPTDADYIIVTREDQWRALLPHPLKHEYPSGPTSTKQPSVNLTSEMKFTLEEAKIRDTYDTFFGYLERFANFVKSGLVEADEFRPYIGYWLDSITVSDSSEDHNWRCVLLTYINYYKYDGVKFLFQELGASIEPEGSVFAQLEGTMTDTVLYERLLNSIQKEATLEPHV
jgi:hypothetical protein